MVFNEQEGIVRICGYQIEVYRNDSDDVVIKQSSFCEDDSVIIVGKEQLSAFIKALRILPSLKL